MRGDGEYLVSATIADRTMDKHLFYPHCCEMILSESKIMIMEIIRVFTETERCSQQTIAVNMIIFITIC